MPELQLKFGRRDAKNAPALEFADVLSKVVPAHPSEWDVILEALDDWQMLRNNEIGDCVSVMWSNSIRALTAMLAGQEYYPPIAQVEQLYKTQNPGFPAEDRGMDIQTMLEYLHTHGGPDGRKAVAFAKVHPTDKEEVDAAISIFGGLYLGLRIQQGQLDDFYAGRPWDYHAGSPFRGGHGVYAAGYSGDLLTDLRFVSWARECSMTRRYVNMGLVEEAWVVVWQENLGTKQFQEGMDMNALSIAYLALTGEPLVVPTNPNPGCLPGVINKVSKRLEGLLRE